jgi:hypothetical protein
LQEIGKLPAERGGSEPFLVVAHSVGVSVGSRRLSRLVGNVSITRQSRRFRTIGGLRHPFDFDKTFRNAIKWLIAF